MLFHQPLAQRQPKASAHALPSLCALHLGKWQYDAWKVFGADADAGITTRITQPLATCPALIVTFPPRGVNLMGFR